MNRRVASILLAAALGLAAQGALSVDQLVSFVRSSVKLQQPDKQVAQYLTKIKLSQALSDRTIEQLQGEGAGPKTVAALHDLRDATAKLPAPVAVAPPPPPRPIPPPSYEEQQSVLNQVREYALNYSKTLPDFICTQVTRRYYDPTGLEFFHIQDTITAKLSYFEQKEKYEVKLVNNQMVERSMESLGGTTSSGEFGSMLRQVFEPKSDAEFHWERWATLRGRRAHVYNYKVEQARSEWGIDYEHRLQITPAYRGLVFVDKSDNKVIRITLEAVEIPQDFPIQMAKTTLDYDYTKIGTTDFLLPLRAEIRLRHDKYLSKNEVEFRLYRKFSAETTLTFDTPEPLDEKKTKEGPQPK